MTYSRRRVYLGDPVEQKNTVSSNTVTVDDLCSSCRQVREPKTKEKVTPDGAKALRPIGGVPLEPRLLLSAPGRDGRCGAV